MAINRESERMKPILEYLKRNMNKGYKMRDLKWALINQGYSRMEVDKAIKHIDEIRAAQRSKLEEVKPEPKKVEIIHEEPKKGFWSRLFG